MNDDPKQALRRALRRERRAWQGPERIAAENAICTLISQHPEVIQAQHIGAYLAFDGEVDLSTLWGGSRPIFGDGEGTFENLDHSEAHHTLLQQMTPVSNPSLRSKVVFPRHQRHAPLTFVRPLRWVGAGPLPLPEGPEIALSDIDVLLIPGVVFSPTQGGRIGLGGGHYDRTLALRVNKSWSVKAFGVGFCFQQRPQLPLAPWDAQLDGIFTERGLLGPHQSIR